MADSAPFYRNMNRYFIRLKEGESLELSAVLQKHLRASVEEAEQLLRQGSVWDSERKVRLQDGRAIIRGELLRVDRPKFFIREYELSREDIRFEDDDLLIVFKRGGAAVQPTPYSDIDNLLHGVQKYYDGRRIAYRAAPINRLDLPAQGLVFFAKNKKCEAALNRLFQEHRVRKRYLAATAAFAGVKPSYIIRSALEWQGRSKEALTYVRFCREKPGRFFFLVFPQSGRTHQIRRHFQEQVAPLLGDVRYGGAPPGSELWLLCFQYSFPHPVGGRTVRVRYLPGAWLEALGEGSSEKQSRA
jgi:23S rRNA-/tRNA-specific pseudouridylate synthase